jgi:hypothetical protein
MNKLDYENTAFQDFERIMIYDIEDGTAEKLVSSMRRLTEIVTSLPKDRDTRAIWLYDKDERGPRLGMLYWVLWKDEIPNSASKQVTKDVGVTSRQYDDLIVITCSCVTDVPDGAIDTLLSKALGEIRKLGAKKLSDISYSKVGTDDFMEEAILKVYCR